MEDFMFELPKPGDAVPVVSVELLQYLTDLTSSHEGLVSVDAAMVTDRFDVDVNEILAANLRLFALGKMINAEPRLNKWVENAGKPNQSVHVALLKIAATIAYSYPFFDSEEVVARLAGSD